MADQKETVVAKAAGLGVALVAAWAAQHLVSMAWKRAFGHAPPKPEDEGDSRWGEIAAAATVSGAVVALARVFATRGAAKLIS